MQLAVALPFDPAASTARAYLDQLARRAPRAKASAAGLDGWLAGRRTPTQPATAIQFFTPARIDFLPPSLSEGHDHAGAGWVNGGQMAAVSGLVQQHICAAPEQQKIGARIVIDVAGDDAGRSVDVDAIES